MFRHSPIRTLAHLRSNSQIYQSDALALARLCMSVFYLHMPNHSTVLFIEVQVVLNLVNQFMSDTPKCQTARNWKVESNYTGSIFIRVCEHFSCKRSFVMRHACVRQGFIFRPPPPPPPPPPPGVSLSSFVLDSRGTDFQLLSRYRSVRRHFLTHDGTPSGIGSSVFLVENFLCIIMIIVHRNFIFQYRPHIIISRIQILRSRTPLFSIYQLVAKYLFRTALEMHITLSCIK